MSKKSKSKSELLKTIEVRATNPLRTYKVEMAMACEYALRRPRVARECAKLAVAIAVGMKRPDLAFDANLLLGVI